MHKYTNNQTKYQKITLNIFFLGALVVLGPDLVALFWFEDKGSGFFRWTQKSNSSER